VGDVGLIGAGVAVTSVAVLIDDSAGWLELLFGSVMVGALLLGLRVVLGGIRRAVVARADARSLAATVPAESARRAVIEERVRLAADIEAAVRAAVTRMASLADETARTWQSDPTGPLEEIQQVGRRATTELRRMLSLLRDAREVIPRQGDAPPVRAILPSRMDLLLAGAVVALAVAEPFLYGEFDRLAIGQPALSALLTAAAAAAVVMRKVAPWLGAAWIAAVFGLGDVVASPVTSGLWMLPVLGGLAWSCAAAARHVLANLLSLSAMAVAVSLSLARWDPSNTRIAQLVMAVGVVGGVTVRWSRQRRDTALSMASRRRAELVLAAERAVLCERSRVARELHDVVSGAIGVMVVQAAAVGVLRHRDTARAHSALDVIRRTGDDTLAELDKLVGAIREGAIGAPLKDAGQVEHDLSDLMALIDRMRSAGLIISFTMDHAPSSFTCSAVYRIVQEALTNVLRHAHEAQVQVTIRQMFGTTHVRVVDDGHQTLAPASRGYGLIGMAERVEQLGGQLVTGPAADGSGFSVAVRLPESEQVTP